MTTLALLAVLASTPDAGVGCAGTPCERFPSAKAAFQRVLERPTAILAIGEYHELEGAPKVPSALKRFTTDMLPLLKGRATSLVAETWMTNGKCGEVEKKATQEVERVTQRPASTEDELTTMLNASHALGVSNHILVISCDEYKGMLGKDGQLDPEQSLLLVKRKVEQKADEVREKGEGGLMGKTLVLYGGALHNDLHPTLDYAPYSFGPALQAVTDGKYVELDLLVPEYGALDDDVKKEGWFLEATRLAGTSGAVLVRPVDGVYILVFAATPPKNKASSPKK
jgi:hypothetical protein